MALTYFGMKSHEFLNKDTNIVTDEAPLIILESKSVMCMDKNGNDSKHTRKIANKVPFVKQW